MATGTIGCKQGRAFILAITLNSVFVAVEFIYGFIANSTALMADAGHNLGDVLAPLMVGARHQRAVLGGVVDVYPLAIPDGEGLEVPVKLLGALGFYNLHGLLVLVVPPAAAEAVREQLAAEIGRASCRERVCQYV